LSSKSSSPISPYDKKLSIILFVIMIGSEIPDAVSALSLARSGYLDGAIAGAIGSQVRRQ
jgi:Ca2+/Na+ antiporter